MRGSRETRLLANEYYLISVKSELIEYGFRLID